MEYFGGFRKVVMGRGARGARVGERGPRVGLWAGKDLSRDAATLLTRLDSKRMKCLIALSFTDTVHTRQTWNFLQARPHGWRRRPARGLRRLRWCCVQIRRARARQKQRERPSVYPCGQRGRLLHIWCRERHRHAPRTAGARDGLLRRLHHVQYVFDGHCTYATEERVRPRGVLRGFIQRALDRFRGCGLCAGHADATIPDWTRGSIEVALSGDQGARPSTASWTDMMCATSM